jgi:HK97 family phage major capsid protein
MPEDTKYQDKLRDMLQEIMGEQFTKSNEILESTKQELTLLKEQNTEFAQKIEKIEKMPAKKVDAVIPGAEDKSVALYKGYNLQYFGKELTITDKYIVAPELRENISKFLIDVVKATNVEGTGSRGGYLVPDEYGDVVMAHARLNSVCLQECQVLPMSTDTLRIPAENAKAAVSWGNEEAQLAASNPTFAEIVLTAQRLGAYTIASNELLADDKYDFVSMLTSQFAEAIAIEIDDSVFNGGNGSTFAGALSGANYTVSCAATGTSPSRHIQITNVELSSAIAALTSNKLMGAKFYFHQNSMHFVRVQEDTAGNPIFALPGNGVPGKVYEYPYVVSAQVGAAAPAASTPFVLFGNMKKSYVIGQRRGNMLLEVDPYGLFDTYRTRFRMVTRWDGAVALSDGLVKIVTHA